jgi:hypothetical protein
MEQTSEKAYWSGLKTARGDEGCADAPGLPRLRFSDGVKLVNSTGLIIS